jgi:hypothetical protein
MSAASAKSQIDFSGHYRTYMYGHWNQNMVDKDSDIYSSDFYLTDRLQFDMAFHATDEVSVYWRLRAPARQRWGSYTAGDSIQSRFFYGEVKQDWGTISAGRLRDDYADFGLASLGWAPGGPDVNATYMGVFDYDDAMSGIRYVNRWDNGFQLAALILRPESARLVGAEFGGTSRERAGMKDSTRDIFALEPAFFWDGGGASLGIHFERNQVSQAGGFDIRFTDKGDPDAYEDYDFNGGNKPSLKIYALNPAVTHSFGDFSIHAEGKIAQGEIAGTKGMVGEDQDGNSVVLPVDKIKTSGYAAYIDFDYNYGPGNVNLAAWWAAGSKDATVDSDSITLDGVVDMGSAFAPLVVAYGARGNGWNRGMPGYGPVTAVEIANWISGPPTLNNNANHMALDLNGSHAFTDDLTLTYAVAYLTLNKTREDEVNRKFKKEIGYEADLGLQIQLLDNLHLGTTFGYLMAGDAMADYDYVNGKKLSPADAYTWLNTLTFNF